MPFGLRFKRTRRYEISSKNAFVVGIHMLDNSFLECTLTSDSTGQECLESIAQRIELNETRYFGLYYVTKKLQFHWVDLERPLKKQLDKYAQVAHCPRLYFRVMYYVPNAHKIPEDVARYQYYLQLKNDIVDGRLPLTAEQAIRLAAFSLQAEFGDYDYDRNPQDYFRDNFLFPKTMTKDENTQTELATEALNGHMSLQGIHPLKSEIQYIKEVQLMDGYGMEYYLAKDSSNKELYLGTSSIGVFARYLDGQPTVFFKWTDIAKISQSKKTLEVDTSRSSVPYQLEDSETAKYVHRICCLQQKFYKSSKSLLSSSLNDVSECVDTESDVIPDIQQIAMPQTDIPDQLTESQTSLIYLQEQRFDQEAQQQTVSAEEYYSHSQQSLDRSNQDLRQPQQPPPTQPPDNEVLVNGVVYSSMQQQIQAPPLQQTDLTYASRVAALPAYRPTPDYETVMKQRLSQQQALQPDSSQNLSSSQIYTQPREVMSYSQPEICPENLAYSQENDYVNSATIRSYNQSAYSNMYHEGNGFLPYRTGERTSNLVMQPTYSSPELTSSQNQPHQYSCDNVLSEAMSYHYNPPPPYPRVSSSTPDLAVQTARTNISNSPDLVSRRNLGVSALAAQSRLDKSLENLAEASQDVGEVSFSNQDVTGASVSNPDVGQVDDSGLVDALTAKVSQVVLPELEVVGTGTAAPVIVEVSQGDHDDTSSEHSNATFHAKESDSEGEASFVRSVPERHSSKSKIHIKYVAPNKAPPHSASKDVATRRESFRRLMIARTSSHVSPLVQSPVDSSSVTSEPLIENPPVSEVIDKSNKNLEESQKITTEETPSDQFVNQEKTTLTASAVLGVQNIGFSADSDSDSIQCLDVTIGSRETSGRNQKTGSQDTSSSLPGEEERFPEEGSDSESDLDDSTRLGPLRLAALNGLTLSRPMVLALMNDESRAPKDERRKILETKLSENLVFKEFEQIAKKAPHMECQIAKMPENESKNRFKDVLPYDSTRVKLTPRKDNSSGYVNASHVKLVVGGREWWYIATQAPTSNTAVDFWQMVWEQEVDVVAMLTAFCELGKKKCHPYWPQEPGAENKTTYGDFEVTLLFCNDSLCYITNRIQVRHNGKERQVWHLQYTDWPDHGCPEDMYGFLGFLDEVESVQRLAESEEGSGKKSPAIVHCSAGVGRTGVVILTQVMKWCLEHNHEVDLPRALSGIRQQRMHMVQTLGQYNFIHKTLIQYLKNSRLI